MPKLDNITLFKLFIVHHKPKFNTGNNSVSFCKGLFCSNCHISNICTYGVPRLTEKELNIIKIEYPEVFL